MTPDERKKLLDSISVEDIDTRFHKGWMYADERNGFLRLKARQTITDMLGERGYLDTILQEMLNNLQEGWNNMRDSWNEIPPKPGASVMDQTLSEKVSAEFLHAEAIAKQAAQGVWGGIQVLGFAINALGDVNGTAVKNWAESKGASPGLAWTLGTLANLGTGFVPVGLIYRTGVQGAQIPIKMVQARRLAKAGKMVAEAQKVTEPAEKSAAHAEAVLKQGMEMEGVKIPGGFTISSGTKVISSGKTNLTFNEEPGVIKVLDFHRPIGEPASPKDLMSTVDQLLERAQASGARTIEAKIENSQLEDLLRKLVPTTKVGETTTTTGVTSFSVSDLLAARGKALSPELGPANMRDVFNADLKAFKKTMAGLTDVQTHSQTQAMANRLGLTLEDLGRLVPGAALNEKEMLAFLKALEPQIKTMYELAGNAAHGGVPETHAFMQHMSSLLQLAPVFRGAEITAGRSVEILKEEPLMKGITNMLMEMDPEKIAVGDFHAAAQTMAENVLAMKSSFAGNNGMMLALLDAQQRARTGLWDGFMTYYKNLLLVMPRGMIRDMLGNSTAIATDLIKTQIGGIFSASKEGLELGSAWYKIKGMHLALGEALQNYKKTFTTGIDVAGSSIFDAPHMAQLRGPVGVVVQTPGLARRAADNWFKTLIRSGSLYEQAMRMGHQKGLKGADLADYVAKKRMYPTDEMNRIADEVALYQTFQNELGTFGKWARQGLQLGPMAMAFPFVKTAMDLKKWAWNHTPGLQLMSKRLYDEIAAGGVAADMAIGRLTWATMQGMFIYQAAQEYLITGSGPIDPDTKSVWRDMGNEPYSLKTPWGMIPLSNFDPASTVWGMMADFAQVHNQLADPQAEQTAMAITFSILHGMTQNTWWPSMNRLVDTVTGVAKGTTPAWRSLEVVTDPAVTVLAGPVSIAEFITKPPGDEAVAALYGGLGGPVAAEIRQATDPFHRETRNMVDDALNQIPGYSKTLRVSRDDLGRPIVPPQGVGSPWLKFFLPLTIRPYEKDERAKLIDRLKVAMPRWSDRVGMSSTPSLNAFEIREPEIGDRFGADLTQKELMRRDELYAQIINHPTDGLTAQVLNDPEFTTDSNGEKTTPMAQKAAIERYFHLARSGADRQIAVESPSLVPRIMQSIYAKRAPLAGPTGQAEMQQDLGLSLQLWEKTSPEERDNLLRWGSMPSEETTP